jgi:hypothetical protein
MKKQIKKPKCKLCWDKGYASVLKNGNYVVGDFEGDKSIQLGMHEIKNYCTCLKGRRLKRLSLKNKK